MEKDRALFVNNSSSNSNIRRHHFFAGAALPWYSLIIVFVLTSLLFIFFRSSTRRAGLHFRLSLSPCPLRVLFLWPDTRASSADFFCLESFSSSARQQRVCWWFKRMVRKSLRTEVRKKRMIDNFKGAIYGWQMNAS